MLFRSYGVFTVDRWEGPSQVSRLHSWRFHTFSAPDIGPFSPRFRTQLPAPCGTGPPPDFLWVLQGFSPGPCVQNKPLGFPCLGLRAVLTASRLFTRTGSVASRKAETLPETRSPPVLHSSGLCPATRSATVTSACPSCRFNGFRELFPCGSVPDVAIRT